MKIPLEEREIMVQRLWHEELEAQELTVRRKVYAYALKREVKRTTGKQMIESCKVCLHFLPLHCAFLLAVQISLLILT
jgi:hypothetical protein